MEVKPKKKRRTPEQALAHRLAICRNLIPYLQRTYQVPGTIHIDTDGKALYWLGKHKLNKFDPESIVVDDALHLYLPLKPYTGRPQHRVIGAVDNGVFSANRVDREWQWHERLGCWTFNKYILLHHEDFGFNRVEINAAESYTPAEMLAMYPDVPVSESGGYERNIQLKKKAQVSATAQA